MLDADNIVSAFLDIMLQHLVRLQQYDSMGSVCRSRISSAVDSEIRLDSKRWDLD
jgi:hypothetical protein